MNYKDKFYINLTLSILFAVCPIAFAFLGENYMSCYCGFCVGITGYSAYNNYKLWKQNS